MWDYILIGVGIFIAYEVVVILSKGIAEAWRMSKKGDFK